jgi:outer membrane receptor protein involved in Fe transport
MKRIFALVLLALWPGTAPARAETGQITGLVEDPAGTRIAGATVRASGPSEKSARSDVRGAYRIDGLQAGRYAVTVSHPGFSAGLRTVDVTAGQTTDVPIVLGVSRTETMIVTASRAETSLADAPATVSVLSSEQLEREPARSWADVLRSVPGINATQTSAREVNVASRQSGAFTSGAQLALVDGRPLLFDFFNIVFWDLNSVGLRDIEQVEVLRGPASVMWGANAATGVVNLITRSPRSSTGPSAALTAGDFPRPGTADGTGLLAGVDAEWAGNFSEKLSGRLSMGFARSDAYARPTGSVPLTPAPLEPSVTVGGGSYDAITYSNRGTQQPRVDARLDQEVGEAGLVVYTAGYAGTEGIFHTPIGPFEIERGAGLGYGRVAFTNGGFRLSAFANLVHGSAPNLVTLDGSGQPVRIDYRDNQYDLDGGYTTLLGQRHLFSAGANVRDNAFDLSIAPRAGRRIDVGVWAQDEIDLEPFRLALALRADKPESLANALVAPRVSLGWTPLEGNVIRASYSRGYRIPSAVENFLDISIIGGYFPLGLIDPGFGNQLFPIVTRTTGNPGLKAETLDAWELSWQGRFRTTQIGVNLYLNDSDRIISSSATPAALAAAGVDPFYTSGNPPPGWPLPPQVLDQLAGQGIVFPREARFLNLGAIRNRGIEISVVQPVSNAVSLRANYSLQARPELRNAPGDPLRPTAETVSVPPRHRFNLGGSYTAEKLYGSLVVNYADKAYWADVLNPAYYGYSKSYVLLNASLGLRWWEGHLSTAIRGTNLIGDKVQQHVFGDVLGRMLALDVGVRF